MIHIVNNTFVLPNFGYCFNVVVQGTYVSKPIRAVGQNITVRMCDNQVTAANFLQCMEVVNSNDVLSLLGCGYKRTNHFFRYKITPMQAHLVYANNQFRLTPDCPLAVSLHCFSNSTDVQIPFSPYGRFFACVNYMLDNEQIEIFSERFAEDERFAMQASELQTMLRDQCEHFDMSSINYCEVLLPDNKSMWGVLLDRDRA